MPDALAAASGRWPELLTALAGLSAEQLTDKHQPCPACGGTDRYRWDRNDGPGGWFCNQCGGKDQRGGAGSGIDLLMRVKGWSLPDACRVVEQHLGLAAPRPEPPTAGAEHVWRYSLDFYVCRFPAKRIRPLWWDGSRWAWKAPPAPRPLYWASPLRPGPVLVAEGEKAADAAVRLFPTHACCTWASGCKALDKSSWQPLAGREVLLWPDADEVGREAMAKLAGRLLTLGCSVTVVDPPAHLPAGWDLADAGDWTPSQAAAVVRQSGRRLEPPAAAAVAEPAPEPADDEPRKALPSRVQPGAPFTCLGFDGPSYYYMPHRTGQVICISGASHKAATLLMLTDLPYWETLYPGSRESVNWTSAISSLLATQADVGVYDPDRVRGRGAWIDGESVVFHLGDRLIIDGAPHPVLSAPSTGYFYEQARHLDGPGPEPLGDDDAMRLCLIAERFRWEVPASANFLLGWTVLAPVCGALNWRPHIWVTGGAGTGKTTILKTFMRPLMGGVLQTATGGTTEPGLRGILKSDAIPVVFDEFEQNEAKDKLIVQNILALARIASSEGGKIYKGTTTGGSNSYEIRSMFCVSSINVSLIQKADIDRFCVLGLRKDEMDKNEWLDFEQEILSVATVSNGRALIARTLTYLPTITQNARVLAQSLGRRFGQRFGDQHGTLLAGAWSLRPGGGGLLTLEQADQWITEMDWDHQQPDPSESDEIKCRDVILQQIVRQGAAIDASFGEMVRCVAMQQSLRQTVWNDLVPVLGRYGLRVFRESQRLPGDDAPVAAVHYLAVANSNAQLDAALRSTPWSGGAHRAALRRITGALVPNVAVHFAGVGTKRCVLVPLTDADLTET
jgi:putative DNA primase/helicase